MKALLAILILFGVSNSIWSQDHSNLVVVSDRATFHLTFDNIMWNEGGDSLVKVTHVTPGSKKLYLLVNDSLECTKNVFLEKGTEHWFELKVKSDGSCKIGFYKTLPVEQTDTITVGRTVISATPVPHSIPVRLETEQPIQNVALENGTPGISSELSEELDSTLLDSLQVLEVYTGRKGCATPSDLQNAIAELENQPFSSRRLKLAPCLLEGKCIEVKDLSTILSLFEFEDHKLQIFKQVKNSVYDLDRLEELSEHFRLKKNLATFKSLL